MSEPTPEELRAAWEREQKRKAYQKAYRQRPEAKAAFRVRRRKYEANLHRLARLAKEAGLG